MHLARGVEQSYPQGIGRTRKVMSLDELRRTVLEVFNRIENLADQRKDEQQKMSDFLNKLDYKKFLESEKKLQSIEAEIKELWISIKPDLEKWKAEMADGKSRNEQ